MEAFSKKIELVGADKGIVISRIGFTKPAISLANRENIELFVAADSDSKLSKVTSPLLEIPLIVKRIDEIIICLNFQFEGIGIETEIDKKKFLRPGNRDLYQEFREAIAEGEIEFSVSDQPLNWVPNLAPSERHVFSNDGHIIPLTNYMWSYQVLKISTFVGSVHDLPSTISRINVITNDTEFFVFEHDIGDKKYLDNFQLMETGAELPSGTTLNCVNAPELHFGPFLMTRLD